MEGSSPPGPDAREDDERNGFCMLDSLETYVSCYSGRAKVQRLVLVADKAEGDAERAAAAGDAGSQQQHAALAGAALRMALEEVKKGENTELYARLIDRIKALHGRSVGPQGGGGDVTMNDATGTDSAAASAEGADAWWVEVTDRRAQQKLERLETQLNGYKSNLIKESIRIGHNDLGDFFYSRGDLQTAFKHYVRTRDYCATSKHIVSMCLNAIHIGLEMKNFDHVNNFITKAEQTPDVNGMPSATFRLKIASGLSCLEAGKYKQAARKFIDAASAQSVSGADVAGRGAAGGPMRAAANHGGADAGVLDRVASGNAETAAGAQARQPGAAATAGDAVEGTGGVGGGQMDPNARLLLSATRSVNDAIESMRRMPSGGATPDIGSAGDGGTTSGIDTDSIGMVSVRDIAIYGTLCALATFERSELLKKVRENPAFRSCLELMPKVEDLANDFHASKYASCLRQLSSLRQSLVYDIFMHKHVDELIRQIRQQALINYTKPFTTMLLKNMAISFSTSVAEIERECADLIISGMINARIDSHNKILYARHMDERNNTFAKVLARGEDYVRETHSLILRAKVMLNDMVQKDEAEEGDAVALERDSDAMAMM